VWTRPEPRRERSGGPDPVSRALRRWRAGGLLARQRPVVTGTPWRNARITLSDWGWSATGAQVSAVLAL